MSAIFYHNDQQKALAEETMKAEAKKRNRTVQTKILPAGEFYDAEDYHQKYLLQRYPYILSQLDMEPGDQLNNSFVATRLNGYVGGYGTMKAFEKDLDRLALPPNIVMSMKKIMGTKSNVEC